MSTVRAASQRDLIPDRLAHHASTRPDDPALLARTATGGIHRVVLDLTGVADFTDIAAVGVLRILRVLRLQGVTTSLSGIGPALAQTIVRAGSELGGVHCHASLAEALTRKAGAPRHA